MSLAQGYVDQLRKIGSQVADMQECLRHYQSVLDREIGAIHREIERSSAKMSEAYTLFAKLQETLRKRRLLKDEAIRFNTIHGHLSKALDPLFAEYEERVEMGEKITDTYAVTLSAEEVIRKVEKKILFPITTEKELSDLRPDNDGQVRVIGGKHIRVFFESWIPYEAAKVLVSESRAAVADENTIVLLQHKRELKLLILRRDQWTCHYCGSFGDTVDHVVPRSKGGRSTVKNLVCACKACNVEKGTMDYSTYVALKASSNQKEESYNVSL